ncbi:MAG: hypothetical protein ISR45_09350 [Rhodospirillales bacterium]|nr:hypothetical protein [Rhodospirillales bacterium]
MVPLEHRKTELSNTEAQALLVSCSLRHNIHLHDALIVGINLQWRQNHASGVLEP